MLTLLCGTNKESKLQYMLSLAENAAQKDNGTIEQTVLWLTPDQFTFETERSLMNKLPAGVRRKMIVTGFMRFSNAVMKKYGGVAVRYADNLCKTVLMRRAIADCRDLLKLYTKQAQFTDLQFEAQLLQFIRQMKFSGVSVQKLLDAQNDTSLSENLRAKVGDLANIALHYEMRLSSAWRDSLDDLTAANEKLKYRAEKGELYFSGKTVILDGFKSFTAPQYDMIHLMLRQGADVYVSLQLDRRQAQSELYSIFALTLDTYDRLLALVGVHCAEKDFPSCQPANALQTVQQGLFLNPIRTCKPDDSVHYAVCRDEYAEAEYCFGKLKSMIKDSDGALRFRDIAIVYRDDAEYLLPIAAAAQKFEIPYCVDGGEQAESEPLFLVCAALLKAAYIRFGATDMLCIVKSGLFPAEDDEAAQLEEYLYVWRAEDLSDWRREFTAKLSGYDTEEFGSPTPLGDGPELLRQRLMAGVEALTAVKSATAKEYGTLLYSVLENMGIIDRFAAEFEQTEDLSLQIRQKRVWNGFGDILTRLSDTLADEKISGEAYYRLFMQSVKETKIKTVGQTLDCVMVGCADKIRLQAPKVLWILGANDGIFPKRPNMQGGLFTDSECRQFSELEITVGKTMEECIAEERFIAYQMINVPSEKLFVSCRATDLGGGKQLAGEIIWRMQTVFGIKAQNGILSEADLMTTPQLALDTYCRTVRSDPETASKYLDLLEKIPDGRYDGILRSVKQMLSPRRYALTGKETVESLYTLYEKMLSPSEIELYYSCPFAYYVKYGLKLRVKERAAYNPLLRGNIVHHVIAALSLPISEKAKKDARRAADEGVIDAGEQIRAEIGKMVRDAFDAEMDKLFENPGRISAKDKALAESILLRITRIAENIYAEQLQSKFKVFAVECDIGNYSIAPLKIPAENGRSVRIRGRIDRLDTYRAENQTFFRIIDYKTGDKKFEYAKLMSGKNLQMILYEMAVSMGGKGGFADLVPAGVLYYPAKEMGYLKDRNLSEQERKAHFDSNYRMDGIVVDEISELSRVRAMEEELRQYYIPVGYNKKNVIDDSSLCSDEQYRRIERYARFKVQKMAREVSAGGIEPAFKTDNEACKYCKYSALCGNDIRTESVEQEKISEQDAQRIICQQEESTWD